MGSLAKWLFKIGYFPIQYKPVKHDFLRWYYKAAQHHRIKDGLDANNPELISLTLEAANQAENFDEESPVISLLDYIDDVVETAETWFHYISLGLVLIGACTIAASWYTLQDLLFQLAAMIGVVVFGCGIVGVSLYHVLKHQLRTNAELVTLFNKELTERPGHIRRNDRDWELLAAQYVWNRSLCKPRTISVLLLLSVIRIISARMYGLISADLQDNIQDFIGMEAREILKYQLSRLPSDVPGLNQHQHKHGTESLPRNNKN